jgi:CRISPR/Cas system CSM-associated protein Csm2 small subunit
MREQLGGLRLRVYRRSIIKDIGVIEAIDEILTEVQNEEERQRFEWLRAVIEAYRKYHRVTAERHACL